MDDALRFVGNCVANADIADVNVFSAFESFTSLIFQVYLNMRRYQGGSAFSKNSKEDHVCFKNPMFEPSIVISNG